MKLLCVMFWTTLGACLIGCKPKSAPQQIPSNLVLYRCSYLYDELQVEQADGTRHWIEFSAESDTDAVNSFRHLRKSVGVGCTPSNEDNGTGRLFFVGELTGKLGHPEEPQRGMPTPRPKRLFTLESWFIQTPFTELPQIPDYEPKHPPIDRNTLVPNDFETGIHPVKILKYEETGSFGLGKPIASEFLHNSWPKN
jgi:hypothetical protein